MQPSQTYATTLAPQNPAVSATEYEDLLISSSGSLASPQRHRIIAAHL